MTKTITEKVHLYNNSVEIDFYPTSHRYKLIKIDGKESGEWIPSPSGINNMLDKSNMLIPWAVGMFKSKMEELVGEGENFTRDDIQTMLEVAKTAHSEKKDAQASVGSVVHHYAQYGEVSEDYEDLSFDDKERADKGIASFEKWKEEHVPEITKSEFLVFSKKHKYVGTADGLAVINGKKYLIDYKTSKGIYTTHLYQVSAYLKAWEEEHGEKLDGAMIIHFRKEDVYDKDGNLIYEAGTFGCKTLSRSELVIAYKGFKGLMKTYHTEKEVLKMLK